MRRLANSSDPEPSGADRGAPRAAGDALVAVAAMLDVGTAVFAFLAIFGEGRATSRGFGEVMFVLAAWVVLAIPFGRGRAFALGLRRTAGVLGLAVLGLAAVTGILSRWLDRGGAFVPLIAFDCAFGAFAAQRELVRRRRARIAASAVVERSRPWSRFAISVFVAGYVWMAAGVAECIYSNFWLGQVVAAFGVFAVASAAYVDPSSTESRFRRADRSQAQWWVYPVAVPLLIARVVWLVVRG